MQRHPIALALAWALATPATAQATPTPDGTDVKMLETVTVTATLTERALDEVPNTVTVIDREALDRQLARDLKDLVRYEPGVSVTSSFGRFGLGGFRIRGLQGNRVLIQTDGIPVSDTFSIGSFSNANRNFVDLDMLRQVEILRGPASAIYGSDALGGVVSFVTKDPSDLVAAGEDSHVGVKLGYQGDNDGLFAGASTAFVGERWSGLLAVSHREGSEPGNMGSVDTVGATRTAPNPQDTDGRGVLAKLVFDASDRHRFRLTLDGNQDSADTDVLTAVNATTLALSGQDTQRRTRIAFGHEALGLESVFADAFQAQVYRQDSRTRQDSFENRSNNTRREREFSFDQTVHGAGIVLSKAFATGSVDHDLSWGVELARTEVEQKRDGVAINLATGAVTNVLLPDVFPVRDFPVSTTTTSALFVQDEMVFADGAFRLVPGLRVDHYDLDPELDAIFTEDNPGVAVSGLTRTSVSPKLGAVWQFADTWSLFGGYARGFRAPPYADVNLGFTNLAFGYTAIPNPDLKPETSHGFELGLRHGGEFAWLTATAFHNDYRDFIESLRFIGVNGQGLMVFQSQNVSDARIQGAELKAGLDLAAFTPSLQGWSARLSMSWQRGDDLTANLPLNSVDPARAVLGLAYEADTWGVELVGNFARRKDRLAELSPGQPAFAPPGHAVFDLLAHWQATPGVALHAGLFNLADRKAWDWADVPGIAASSTVLDRYTRPGRHAGLSLSVNW